MIESSGIPTTRNELCTGLSTRIGDGGNTRGEMPIRSAPQALLVRRWRRMMSSHVSLRGPHSKFIGMIDLRIYTLDSCIKRHYEPLLVHSG
jgi:hypothetical protein